MQFTYTDKAEIKNVKRTPQGGIKFEADICRTGLLEYHLESGLQIDVRKPEDLFKKSFLDSVSSSPVTTDHPDDMIDSTNWRQHAVGYAMGEPRVINDEFVRVVCLVNDEKSIQDVLDKKINQISIGGFADRRYVSGEWNGKPYDAEQTNIICNHIGLVPYGRAGPDCSIKKFIDKKDDHKTKDITMKIKILDKEYEVSEEAGEALKKEQSRFEDELKDSDKIIKALNTKIERAEGKLILMEQEIKDSKDIDSKVFDQAKSLLKDFMSTVNVASKILKNEELEPFYDSLDLNDLKKKTIKAYSPTIEFKDSSESKIEGMFDVVKAKIADSSNEPDIDDDDSPFLDSQADTTSSESWESIRKKSMLDAMKTAQDAR